MTVAECLQLQFLNNAEDILNPNDYFNVETYWSRCLDPYWWGVEFKAFGENQILDLFVANEDTNVIMLLLLGWCYFLSMVLLDRNSKVYEMVPLWWKCHNFTVFRLRIVNSICTSSDEKITGEKRNLGDDQCRRNSRGWRWGKWTTPRSSRTSSQ
jgi:hypothetical protein